MLIATLTTVATASYTENKYGDKLDACCLIRVRLLAESPWWPAGVAVAAIISANGMSICSSLLQLQIGSITYLQACVCVCGFCLYANANIFMLAGAIKETSAIMAAGA